MKVLLMSITWACTTATGGNRTVSIDDNASPQKIIGGFPVAAGTYPFYAQFLSTGGSFYCGSSLVSPEFILTAAHCTEGETPSSIKFKIGALCNDANNCGQYSESKTVKQIFNHPQYNSNTMVNDFALVQLTSRSAIQPVSMDTGNISPNYVQGKRNLYTTGTLFISLVLSASSGVYLYDSHTFLVDAFIRIRRHEHWAAFQSAPSGRVGLRHSSHL
jgi:secreted trypsin-like serine protease